MKSFQKLLNELCERLIREEDREKNNKIIEKLKPNLIS